MKQHYCPQFIDKATESKRLSDLFKVTPLVTGKLGYDPELTAATAFPLYCLHTLRCLASLKSPTETQD